MPTKKEKVEALRLIMVKIKELDQVIKEQPDKNIQIALLFPLQDALIFMHLFWAAGMAHAECPDDCRGFNDALTAMEVLAHTITKNIAGKINQDKERRLH